MRRKPNIPVSGPTTQEEALLIAERLHIKDVTASNGWLEKLKKQHNICIMTVAEGEGDVRPETVESWSERAREITRGYRIKKMFGTWTKQAVFGAVFQTRSLTQEEKDVVVENRQSSSTRGHFLLMLQEKKKIRLLSGSPQNLGASCT